MKIKLLLALAAAAILVTITTSVYLVRGYLAQPEEPGDASRTAPARVLDELAAAVGLEEDSPAQRARQAAADAPVLRGRVDLFGACAAADEVQVFALSRPADLETVITDLEREAGAAGDDPAERDTGLILARTTCELDGEFELRVEGEHEELHVIAIGELSYQQQSSPATPESRSTLVPYCGAHLVGRVLGRDDLGGVGPVARPRVRVTSRRKGRAADRRGLLRLALGDEQGEFGVGPLPLPGDYQVEIQAEGFAPLVLDAEDLDLGETRRLAFELGPGAAVAGRVVDEEGRAVEGAKVFAVVEGNADRTSYGRLETQSDAKGGFRFEHVAADRVTVLARSPGYLESPPTDLVAAEGGSYENLLLVLERGSTITGQVIDVAGSPAADVLVEVRFDRARQFARFGSLNAARGARGEARTDEQGRFHVEGLGKGPFSVSVEREAPAGDRQLASAHGVAPGTADLTLRLAPPLSVSGRVLDAEGTPLEHFGLRAALMMETEIGVMARDTLDERFAPDPGSGGAFTFSGLTPGLWHLYATAEGHATSPPLEVELPADATVPLEFRLERAATLRGLVLSPRGAPVAGARVERFQSGPTWQAAASGAPSPPNTRSAEDGSFTLRGLPPGELHVAARAEGYALGEAVRLDLEAGEEREGVELTLREGARLTGEVFGGGSLPAQGALVQLVSSPDFNVLFAYTDDEGRFEFDHLESGSWQVIAMPPRDRLRSLTSGEGDSQSAILGEMKVAIVELEEGAAEHTVLGAPPGDPLEVTGVLTSNLGDTEGMVLEFHKSGVDSFASSSRVTTRRDGAFSVVLDGAGTYIVSAKRSYEGAMDEAEVQLLVEIPESERHELRLELPSAGLRGRIVNEEGAPCPFARVSLSQRGARRTDRLFRSFHGQLHADEQGRYAFEHVPPGPYLLSAGGMTAGGLFERSATYGQALSEVELSAGEVLEVEPLVLPEPLTARVRVVDAGGRPVEGAAIFARSESGHLLDALARVMTDATGLCEYHGLAPGRYSFAARADDLAAPESALVDVSPGAPCEVSLELQEATLLLVQLRDAGGRPTSGEVLLYDSEGREMQGMLSLHEVLKPREQQTFEVTRVRLGPLPPGKYLVVGSNGEASDRRPLRLSGQVERKLTLRLR